MDCGPHPDLWSAQVGLRHTIGHKFGRSLFSGRELAVCRMGRVNPCQIAVKTFFFWSTSHFGRQIAMKTFLSLWISGALLVSISFEPFLSILNLFWTQQLFICHIWTFAKTSQVPLFYSVCIFVQI